MAWLELHQSVRDHRKIVCVAELLDMPEPHVVGHLAYLWLWAVDNAPDGVLPKSVRVIARAAWWEGDAQLFVASLSEAKLLDASDDGWAIHDWDSYAGKLLRQRKANAERQSRHRERTETDSDGDVTVTSPSRNGATVQNSTEQNNDAIASSRATRKSVRATATPGTYTPSQTQYVWAESELGFDASRVDRETEKFLDNHRSRGSTLKDWDAAWRNWMRRAVEYAPRGKAGAPTQSVDGSAYFDGTQWRRADGLVV